MGVLIYSHQINSGRFTSLPARYRKWSGHWRQKDGMKKDITIKIPDNLSPGEEVIAIAKKLQQKVLTSTGVNNDQKRIGTPLDISYLETNIKVIRENKEKPLTFCKCNVCGKDYQSDTAVYAWTNYGGTVRKIVTCSAACVETLVTFSPNRISSSKKKLSPLRTY